MSVSSAPIDLHVISDSTGETAGSAVRAALALFDLSDTPVQRSTHVFIRNIDQIDAILSRLDASNAVVIYTLTDPGLADRLEDGCRARSVTSISLLDPLIAVFSRILSKGPKLGPGRQYRVDQSYDDRIAAIDFAMSHDDGVSADYLLGADVILVGVSRTSKTPTCIYLAYQGIKAANVPLIPQQDPPSALLEAMKAGVVTIGLVATPARLSQVRKHRLGALGRGGAESYADLEQVRGEVAEARLFFDRHELPVIDVTRRSIEETAAGVMAVLRERGVLDQ